MNKKFISILLEAQQELNRIDSERAEDNDSPLHCNDFRNRLLFADVGNGLAIEYFGDVWQDGDESAWDVFLQTLSNPAIAERLTSLRITGPDEGANGSRTHDFGVLIQSKASFPKLLELYIRPTGVSDHNFVGIEDGQIALLIVKCPNLEMLTLPQSPEPDFFNIQLKHLRYARFGMSWQTFGFVRNMALHHNMPELRMLDFTDSLSVFHPPKAPSAEYDDSMTPFEDYCALIKSPAIHKGMVLHLRNAALDEAQFKQLNGLKDVQLSVSLEAPHVYISHWDSKFATPYRHLIIPR
jgi:hypothetical protein